MRRALISSPAIVSCLLFIVIVIGNVTIVVSQSTVTGEWRTSTNRDRGPRHPRDGEDTDAPDIGELSRKGDVNIQFERWSGKSNHNSIGTNFTYSELGVTEQQIKGSGPVSFRLDREAGAINGQGTCANYATRLSER